MKTLLKKQIRTGRLMAAILMSLCCWMSVGCAAATIDTAKTSVIWDHRLPKLTPAKKGHQKVWVDYQDASGGTEDLIPVIEDAIEAKGYDLADSHEEADFVLWATLRFYDEINEDTKAAYNAIRAGAIVGGGAGAAIGYSQAKRKNRLGTSVAAGAGGALVGAAIGYGVAALNAEHQYEAILDVQLARRVQGGVSTNMSSNQGTSTSESQAAGSSSQGVNRSSVSGSHSGTSQGQSMVEQKVHFETENRLRVLSKGRRLTREIAFQAIIRKLKAALPSTLPRPPRRRR